MLDDDQSLRAHLPSGSYLLFVLVAGVMAGLVVWSVISAPRTRAAAEDRDLRGQLQTELRSLVGATALAPATAQPSLGITPLTQSVSDTSWKWLAFVLLIGVAFTLWFTVNHYVGSTTQIDDTSPMAAEAPRPPLVVVPEWMKVAVRSSRDGIMTLDQFGRIMTANPAAEKILGFENGRLPGRKALDFLADIGEGADGLRRFSQVASATGVTAAKKDGTAAPLRLAVHRVSEKSEVQYLALFSAAEPVIEATAPVAPAPVVEPTPAVRPIETATTINEDALHDLANQVVMLGGYSELVVEALSAEHPARPDAEAVSRSAARASVLCHEVAQTTQPHPRTIDLNEFVIAVAAQLSRVLDEGCEVKGFRGQGSADVWADPDLLERSLSSLAWRTQDLAGGLKRVSISVSNGRLDLRMVPAGATTQATPAAFDALQAVDWIEKQNGTIEMEEHSETGVRFRIWLPAAAQARLPRMQAQGESAAAD